MSERALRSFDSLTDRLRLHFQGSRQSVVLVEGEADRLILGELLPDRTLFPAGTRARVLDTARELHELGLCFFAAVYDPDFEPAPPPFGTPFDVHLYAYKGRDLECMLIDLGGLDRLLNYKGSTSKIEKLGGVADLIDELTQIVQPVSRLRLENAKHGMGLRFDAVPLQDKVGQRDLCLALESYCTALAWASDGGQKPGDLMKIALNDGQHLEPRGKDVIAIAGVALRARAGTLAKAACDPELLAKDLLAVSQLVLSESHWFRDLLDRLTEADEGRLGCA